MNRLGTYYFQSDIGKQRKSNEDNAIIVANENGDILMIVCDGMGGHNCGELASKTATSAIALAFEKKKKFASLQVAKWWLGNIIKKVNTQIYKLANSNDDYHDMGTTLVAVLVLEKNLVVANIGDSRAYILTKDALVQITEDQTYVNFLYKTGRITEEEIEIHPKRHVLMNALGIYPAVNLDISILPYEGQPILLCSDGLYTNVNHSAIENVLRGNQDVEPKGDELIAIANSNGGSDNIAIALWEVL